MPKVAIQIVKVFYTCIHKNVIRTFITSEGIFDERIPCCIEKGCNGNQMARTRSSPYRYITKNDPEGSMREGFWEVVERREV